MRREPGVVHRRDARVARQERGDLERILGVSTHAVRERPDPPEHEPAVERRRDGATRDLEGADPVEELVARLGDDGATHHVGVPAEVLGRRVQDQVGAEPERRLEDGRGGGVVAEVAGAGGVGDLADARNVRDLPQGVRGRLRPHEPRVRLHRLLHGGEIGHVDERRLEPPAAERLAQQARGAVIGVERRDDVVAGGQRLEDRGRRRRGRRERRRRLAALERGQTRLERAAVRIGVARVEEAARIRAVGLALERGGRVDGGRDRARPRIDAGARVHGDRLDSHGTHLTRGRFRWRR